MTIRQTTLAAAFALAAIGPAHAEGLTPLQGQLIDLGDVSGVAYYTVERDGFRVVATLAKKGEDAVPVRVVAMLAPGQSLTLSIPHEAGTPPEAVDFIRRSDTVLVNEAPAARADTALAHKAAAPVTN
jgi:non-ribosomal peptide synthetase component F